jgi:hypothetical protein
MVELNGYVESAIAQYDGLRAVIGWHDGAAEYEYLLICDGKLRCAFLIIYEYERGDIASAGCGAKGFLAEIVYNSRVYPHQYFPSEQISEFAVASIKGSDDEVGLLELLKPARDLIRSCTSASNDTTAVRASKTHEK